MQKSQASTTSQITIEKSHTKSERKLINIIKNLQLELGYRAIALKKAEQMASILERQNEVLKAQNQQLISKCMELEFKITKFQNQFTKIGFILPCVKTRNYFSPEKQRRQGVFDEQHPSPEFRTKDANSPERKKRPKNQLVHETPFVNNLHAKLSSKLGFLESKTEQILNKTLYRQKTTLKQKPDEISFNESYKKSKNIKTQRKSPSLSPAKNSIPTINFIPFEKLTINTHWN